MVLGSFRPVSMVDKWRVREKKPVRDSSECSESYSTWISWGKWTICWVQGSTTRASLQEVTWLFQDKNTEGLPIIIFSTGTIWTYAFVTSFCSWQCIRPALWIHHGSWIKDGTCRHEVSSKTFHMVTINCRGPFPRLQVISSTVVMITRKIHRSA